MTETRGIQMRSRMLALVAGLLFLGSVVGVAVVSRSASSGDLPRLPFGAAGARSAAMADSAMPAFRPVVYKLGDGVERPTDKATAYRMIVNASEATKVAKALGLEGQAKAAEGGAWVVTDGDKTLRLERSGSWNLILGGCGGAKPMLGDPSSPDAPVSSDGSIDCTVGGVVSSSGSSGGGVSSDGGAATTGSAGASEPDTTEPARSSEPPPPSKIVCDMPECPPDSACTQACPGPDPAPVRPADLPTKADARAQALKVLSALGFDAESGKLNVDDGFTNWSISFEPEVDGTPVSGLGVGFGIGSKGVIEWAGGWVADLETVGDYPLATLATGVKRLNDGTSIYGGPEPLRDETRSLPPLGEPETKSADAASAGSPTQVAPVPPDCGGPTGDCAQPTEPTPAPAPCSDAPELTADCVQPEPVCQRDESCPPVPEPEPQIVTLTKVEMGLTLVMAPEEAGPAYLVPAFVFSGDGAEGVAVVAVIDDLLAKPPTSDVDGTKPGAEQPTSDGDETPQTLIAPVPKD